MNKYILTGYRWGYNGETIYATGNFIEGEYDSIDKAKEAKLNLDKKRWQNQDLGETNQFFDEDVDLINKVNSFVKEKTGEELFAKPDRRGVTIPSSLNDDEFLEFLDLAKLESYRINKIEKDDAIFHVIWMIQDDEVLSPQESFFFSPSLDELVNLTEIDLFDSLQFNEELLEGSIQDLSNGNGDLEEFLSSSDMFGYDEEYKTIEVLEPEPIEDLYKLNSLLKVPLFKIKSITAEEVKEITREMEGDCYD